MTIILTYLREYILAVDKWLLFFCSVWMGILITLNYQLGIEREIIAGLGSRFEQFIALFLVYYCAFIIPYVFAIALRRQLVTVTPMFWLLLVIDPPKGGFFYENLQIFCVSWYSPSIHFLLSRCVMTESVAAPFGAAGSYTVTELFAEVTALLKYIARHYQRQDLATFVDLKIEDREASLRFIQPMCQKTRGLNMIQKK